MNRAQPLERSMGSLSGRAPWRNGFTLLELVVTLAIVALLAAVLLPALFSAREKARASACLSNYHQIGMAIHAYAADFDGLTPPDGGSFSGIIRDCSHYLSTSVVFTCPDDDDRDEEHRAGSYRMPSLYQGLPIGGGWTDPYFDRPAEPTATTLMYEAEQDFAQSPIVPTYRHRGGTQILAFDGHARWIPRTG